MIGVLFHMLVMKITIKLLPLPLRKLPLLLPLLPLRKLPLPPPPLLKVQNQLFALNLLNHAVVISIQMLQIVVNLVYVASKEVSTSLNV